MDLSSVLPGVGTARHIPIRGVRACPTPTIYGGSNAGFSRGAYAPDTCVVVGTIQTLRVSNTEGRKVYAHHEDLESHFSAVPLNAPDLERSEGGPNSGRIKFSFANLMHLHRPLMIVDEAHNAMTGLSRDMQARVNPCAIVEFTATPHLNSNILHNVTAQELKREEMIKLPIVLTEHADWQSAVSGAVATRAALAEEASLDTAG
jgi:type III restriction enzyme